MELADLGRVRCRSHRAVLLRVCSCGFQRRGIFHGRIFCFLELGRVFDSWLFVRSGSAGRRFIAERFSALDLYSDCCACCRVFSVTESLRRATGAASSGAPRVGKRHQTSYYWIKMENLLARRFAVRLKSRALDFLPRFLVTAMATPSCGVFSNGCRSSRRVAYALSASASIHRD